MNDGEASGGQQVMKSLVLLIGLLKSEDGSGGFVFIESSSVCAGVIAIG